MKKTLLSLLAVGALLATMGATGGTALAASNAAKTVSHETTHHTSSAQQAKKVFRY